MEKNNLRSSNLGFSSKDKFVLARYQDQGHYSVGNCRFITQKENAIEKTITEKSRKASSENIRKFNKTRTKEDYEELSKLSSESRKIKATKTRKIFEQNAHPSFLGKNNSQYGSFWITNGQKNQKWGLLRGPLPAGFYKGRKIGRGW